MKNKIYDQFEFNNKIETNQNFDTEKLKELKPNKKIKEQEPK